MNGFASLAAMVAVYSTLALSFLIVMRMGEISFGQQAYFGIGAYVGAALTTMFHWDFAAATVVAAACSIALAGCAGLVILRMTGYEFSLYSLVLAEFVREVLGRVVWQVEVDGAFVGPEGTMGFAAIDSFARSSLTALQQVLIVVAVAAAALAAVQRLGASRHGRLLAAAAADRELAEARGVPVQRLRAGAYMLAAGVSGLGGSLFAHYVTFIDPANFGLMTGVHALAYTLIGGIAQPVGALFGTALDVVLLESMRIVGSYRMVAFGLLIVAVVALLPRGIFAMRRHTRTGL